MENLIPKAILEAALEEWAEAVSNDQVIRAWRKANPDSPYGPPLEWFKAHGIPSWGKPGCLCRAWRPKVSADGWWYMKLRQPTEWGSHLIQCRQCQTLQPTHHPMHGSGLCVDCRGKQLEQRAIEKAEQRIERRKQHSAELANRKGKCLVCGSEMTVARTTRTTCSDRCRKQWTRKGPEAFPLPEAPATVKIGSDGEPMPLKAALDSLQQVRCSVLRTRIAAIMSGGDRDLEAKQQADLDQIGKGIKQVKELIGLQRLRDEAPAIFLWKMSQ